MRFRAVDPHISNPNPRGPAIGGLMKVRAIHLKSPTSHFHCRSPKENASDGNFPGPEVPKLMKWGPATLSPILSPTTSPLAPPSTVPSSPRNQIKFHSVTNYWLNASRQPQSLTGTKKGATNYPHGSLTAPTYRQLTTIGVPTRRNPPP